MNAPKVPNEIYITKSSAEFISRNDCDCTYVKIFEFEQPCIKYLSEDHVKELLSEKDKEIKRLQEYENSLYIRKTEHIELLKSEIESKDKEIERFKSETNLLQDYLRLFIRTHGLDNEWERFLLANPTELPKQP